MNYFDLDDLSNDAFFKSLPLWQRQLWVYEANQSYNPKKITLPSTNTEGLLEDLLKRYPARRTRRIKPVVDSA